MSENCAWSRARLALYLDEELPAEERARLASHLESCRVCRAALENLRRAETLMREAAGAGEESGPLGADGTAIDGDEGGEAGAEGAAPEAFDAWLETFRGRHDLEAARRLRADESAAEREAGRIAPAYLSAEEVAARPLEPELRRAGWRAQEARAHSLRAPSLSPDAPRHPWWQRVLGPHPAWRWIGVGTATAAAAAVIVVILVHEPDLPHRALAPSSPGETLERADAPLPGDEARETAPPAGDEARETAPPPREALTAKEEVPPSEKKSAPPASDETPRREAPLPAAGHASRVEPQASAVIHSDTDIAAPAATDALAPAADAARSETPADAAAPAAANATAEAPADALGEGAVSADRPSRGLGFSTITAGPTAKSAQGAAVDQAAAPTAAPAATRPAAPAEGLTRSASDRSATWGGIKELLPADSLPASADDWLRRAEASYAAWAGTDREAAEDALVAYERVLAMVAPDLEEATLMLAADASDSTESAAETWTVERLESIEQRVRELKTFLATPR